MSLVTTASRSSAPSARQSAATSAVLPDPTGPPIPMRNARGPVASGACGSTPGSGWLCGTSSTSCACGEDGSCGCCSGCKETHLPGCVELGADVEQGGTGRRQGVDRGGEAGRGG